MKDGQNLDVDWMNPRFIYFHVLSECHASVLSSFFTVYGINALVFSCCTLSGHWKRSGVGRFSDSFKVTCSIWTL